MKRTAFFGFFFALTAAGCLPLLPTQDSRMPPAKTKAMSPSPSVTSSQVNSQNARQISQALWEEMERADQEPITVPNEVNEAPKTAEPVPQRRRRW
jgi:hypothetical protein